MICEPDQAEPVSGSGRQSGKRRSRGSGASSKRQGGRESPLGAEREREFPTTKIGVTRTPEKGMGGGDNGGHERQYNFHSHQGHARCGGSHAPRSVITGDLGQSRDFHYTVEPVVYRRPMEVASYHSPQQASHTLQQAGHTLQQGGGHTLQRPQREAKRQDLQARQDYAYVDHKASPYHSGLGMRSSQQLRDDRRDDVAGRMGRAIDQNYMLVRAQSRLQDDYEHLNSVAAHAQRSDSRADLLEADKPVYEPGLYYQPGQYSGFVRTCDGKFIRTNIPAHDFDTLDSNFYRNTSAMHTIRRSKNNRHGAGHNGDFCCPTREDTSSSGFRASDQLQQSYATLRGRKWSDKNCGRGVGDNYGRHGATNVYMDDSRSVHSLTDDFLVQSVQGHQHRQLAKTISRSTDKSLDSLGLEEEGVQFPGLASLATIRSDEVLTTMLTREPPDGKEKPEPPRHQKHETLSRKNSKCDLLDGRDCRAPQDNNTVNDARDAAPTQPTTPSAEAVYGKRVSDAENVYGKRGSISAAAQQNKTENPAYSGDMVDSGQIDDVAERIKDWKVPASPRCPSVSSVSMMPHSAIHPSMVSSTHPSMVSSSHSSIMSSSHPSTSLGASPKPVIQGRQPSLTNPQVVGRESSLTSQMAARALNNSAYSEPCTSLSPLCHDQPSIPVQVKTFISRKICRFFGVDASNEEQSKLTWIDRRKRLAIKKLGGVKEEELLSGFGVENAGYGVYGEARNRGVEHLANLTSELEGDKMVLKISKPPRDKDSIMSLSWQVCSWMVSSGSRLDMRHPLQSDHDQSRSYLPSAAGQAAYYQAETCGGLAVCQPLTRISNHHHFQGESPAEEVFFNKPTSEPEPTIVSRQKPYVHDPYRSCSWQLPKTESEVPRMSSDVGVSRIWNRMLDAAFDNSNRRKHGMGLVGKVVRKRRMVRRMPESSRKRKLGGNSRDHRPYFTYWVTAVQVLIMFISLLFYGLGPIGVDLYKKSGMVLVTSLSLENVGYLEPANFWIGPAALDLVHLGAKYGPCMRWDEQIDRTIKDDRSKERDTACCLIDDQAGCVQTQKSECKGAVNNVQPIPNTGSNKWRLARTSNPWDVKSWEREGHGPGSWAMDHHHRTSGTVCGLDPAYCEAPASVAPYVWPDDITKWPICRKRKDETDTDNEINEAEHMVCEVIGHPCCIGIRGHCQIATKEFCDFVKGVFHDEAALCSQVSCMNDVCGLLPFRQRDVPDQFYRIWTSLFLHAGIFHLVISVVFQYWLMRDLEKMCGAGRIAIIYLGSGMVGNLASAIFVPYRAEVGPAGSHFGLLACCIVEVIHQWPSLKYPEMAILKLVGVTAVFFLSGLLPWIDNYAHLFGFIFGFLLSYAIMPYVTFGLFDRRRKLILLIICLLSAVFIFMGLVLLFYVTPIHDCEICKYFNCIPITKDFCSEQNIDLRTEI